VRGDPKAQEKRVCNGSTALQCMVVFAGDAYARLKASGATQIVTTNTIPSKAARIDVTSLIAQTLIKK